MCNHRHKAKPGRQMCEPCRRKSLARQRKKWAERIANQLCVRCGKRKASKAIQLCPLCTKHNAEKGVLYRKQHFFLCRAQDVHTDAHFLWSLWKRQRGRCALTGLRLTRINAAIDHVVAISKGGTNQPMNLQWTTKLANLAKSDMSYMDFLAFCAQVLAYANLES